MAVTMDELAGLWRKFSAAIGIEAAEPGDDGSFGISFSDGSEVAARLWQGEAVLDAKVADVASLPADAARRFLRVSVAKSGAWPECLYADKGVYRLWRRFRSADEEDFSIAGIEDFLNRLDFWRGQAELAEVAARRQAPSGSFIAYDQFG